MDGWLFALTLFAVLTCGVMAGLFFTFSVFAMRSLDRLPSPQGMAAMQHMNRDIQNPLFGLAFIGSTLACLALGIYSLVSWPDRAGFLLSASIVYLLGAIVLTGAYHIPRNNALDQADINAADAGTRWSRYVAEWLPWNHVRLLASLVATGLFATALHA